MVTHPNNRITVLFVCLGNICRSPLAEAIFNDKVHKMGIGARFEADSCGTGDYHSGQQPDPRTIKVANKNGIAISHACRQLVTKDLDVFDFILAMDQSNLKNIAQRSNKQNHHKIFMMRYFDPQAKDADVPDPYYGDDRDFQEVYEILDRCISGFLRHLDEGVDK